LILLKLLNGGDALKFISFLLPATADNTGQQASWLLLRCMCHNMSMSEAKQMICEICGKEGARVRRVARTYGKGKDILVIENVPVVTCPHCGESYLDAETLHEIERIKLHKKSFAEKRPVPVAHFA